MSTYTIGEVADRSGFSASALRYYEGIGLVAPATRTGAGYRLYDDRALGRLAFIARAKQLGCSLEEITDLVSIWDGERCAPVQRRFHDLVTDKVRHVRRQLVELSAFAAQLQGAAEQLSGAPVDGPCGPDCACVSSARAGSTSMSAPPVTPAGEPSDAPIACTLEPSAMPDRLADWQALLGRASTRSTLADGALRIEFRDDVDAGDIARLAAAEQRCCAFFSFALMIDPRGVVLEVRAPDGAGDIVASMLGPPA